MNTGPHDPVAMAALGEYVRARRHQLDDSTIRWASQAAGISDTKWIEVEHGKGPHSRATLIKIARALDESPKRILEMAGMPYVEEELPPADSGGRAIEARLDRLELRLGQMIELIRDLDRRTPGRSPDDGGGG